MEKPEIFFPIFAVYKKTVVLIFLFSDIIHMIQYPLTAEFLKKQLGRELKEFVKKAGYRNVSKGMRRMTEFFKDGKTESDLLEKILAAASGESYESELNDAVAKDIENDRNERDALQKQKDTELHLLYTYRSLLMDNVDRIMKTPEYAFCKLLDAHKFVVFMGGGILSLGSLILLWKAYEKSGNNLPRCGKCGGLNLPVRGPVSGRYGTEITGFCSNCGDEQVMKTGLMTQAIDSYRALGELHSKRCEKPMDLKNVLRELGAEGEDVLE